MPVESLLGRLVVIGGDHEEGVGADLLGVLGEGYRLGGRVRAGSGDHGDAAFRLLHADLDDPLVLLVAERRAFSRRSHGNKAFRAVLDLPVHMAAKGLLVEQAVPERGHEGGDGASETGHGGCSSRSRLVVGSASLKLD
jgi:hypothetical protein